ncbi:peptidylprolyl isomerase [Desulfovibrio inopinatus]|uniref:peptidylprolyl isomerase n=1 Tax=Desulfovibrio inopinatus TaxID=102109 RepID=UPI00040738C3|nr:peptidylprolyl isomerase [Desulfovibrio inopinatus]
MTPNTVFRRLAAISAVLCFCLCVFSTRAHAQEPVYVQLTTNKGNIVLELDPKDAPVSVENFLKYVKRGVYDGTIFHRVIDGFMIQGGGFDANFEKRPTDTAIRNEADNGLKNTMYTIAMARTMDPHSATNQFFINVNNNGFLDHTSKTATGWGYAVFGKVIKGQNVVDAIKSVPTTSKGPYNDVPVDPVILEKAEVIANPSAS